MLINKDNTLINKGKSDDADFEVKNVHADL
jgi:hypothetical protein